MSDHEPKDGAPASLPEPLAKHPAITPGKLLEVTELLESLVEDRGQLAVLDKQALGRLLEAAGKVAHPGRAAKRRLIKALRAARRGEQQQRKLIDGQLLDKTGIRQRQVASRRRLNSAPPVPLPLEPARREALPAGPSEKLGRLNDPRNCYICKSDYHEVHHFYDSLCPACARVNWDKRNQTADLSGRFAMVTGGRVKIGFEAALKLLRGGADVVVTTRFPGDAANRFMDQEDSPEWQDRLRIYGLDMRHTPSVEQLAEHLSESLPRLDFLLNNACQTVRRPPQFYRHLMEQEEALKSECRPHSQAVLADYLGFLERARSAGRPGVETTLTGSGRKALQAKPSGEVANGSVESALTGIRDAAELSQVALLAEDQLGSDLFPVGSFDSDCQQVDLRQKNSWRLKLEEVSTIELLEVQLVNAVAPYILNGRLRGLMSRTPADDKHIVNVSAMEGVFYRAFKRDTHPHTNMAKAALNMMTRTSAIDYLRDGIHMNSVDTGWITDEDPAEIAERKRRERGFSPPLDNIDAAARICAPIFDGLNSGHHVWGKFLKDYNVSNW